MKKNKGQALIEFIIVLPIILTILLYMIEFGNITIKKYELETQMDLIIDLYKNKKEQELTNYITANNIIISYTKENELTTITIKKNIETLPLIKKILNNNIETKRTIYEQ